MSIGPGSSLENSGSRVAVSFDLALRRAFSTTLLSSWLRTPSSFQTEIHSRRSARLFQRAARAHVGVPAVSILALALFPFLAASAPAQSVSGVLFEDLNRNGVQEFGEPLLAGLPVTLFGENGNFDQTLTTGPDGAYLFTATTGADYVLDVAAGDLLRLAFQTLVADPDPIPDWPQGRRRPGLTGGLVAHLRAATPGFPLLHVSLGDSIAYGFNLCDSPSGKNGYVQPFTDRLDRAGVASLQKEAVLGYTTADLLDPTGTGTIFDAINAAPQLVSISIGGNDFLADDGDKVKTAANLVAARQNLQELLSTLATELPDADVVLNTVYDNAGGKDAFHDEWGPIWNQALRDLAWGQRRRVAIAEIWPDYEHTDPATGNKLGEDQLICSAFGLDKIHPKKRGYDLHEEKVWQGVGGVTADANGEARDFGFLRLMATRLPSQATDLGGGASNTSAAFAEDSVGATIPGGNQELRLAGFDATPRGLLSQAVVKLRYRTSGAPSDDTYRFEASVDGTFAAPGSDSQSWNTIVPIVGASGLGAPVLVFGDQPQWREVSALVTKGAAIDGAPSITWQDLATLAIRVKGTATGAADPFSLEWDVASLELYGVAPYTLFLRGSPQLGDTLEIVATGTEGDDDWLFASAAAGNVPFPPWGTFLIDLSQLVIVGLGSVDATGAHVTSIDLPNDPALVGVTAYLQSLVVESYHPKVGALTNLATVTLR